TVPFLRLADVPQPPADVVADAVVETDRVQEFLYDNLCQCIAPGQECNRPADCCTNGATNSRVTCFSDPALGGDSVCSDCRGTIYTDQSYLENVGITSQEYDSCNVDSDCCETGAVCSQTAVPTSCGYVQSGQFTFWTCNLTTPPTKVCQRPTPYVAPPDIR